MIHGSNLERHDYGLIGTAFDYRLRYYFALTPLEELVAGYTAGWRDISRTPSEVDLDDWLGFWDHFGTCLEKTLHTVKPLGRPLPQEQEELLNRYCVILAHLEQLYRAYIPQSPLHEIDYKQSKPEEVKWLIGGEQRSRRLLDLPRQAIVDDLCNLSWAFYDRHGELMHVPTILNPTFEGSTDVDGADADLIVGKTLLDIKTSKMPNPIKSEDVYQLLGYVLLDYGGKYGLERVGWYLARRALLVDWSVEEFLHTLGCRTSLVGLRNNFRRLVSRL